MQYKGVVLNESQYEKKILQSQPRSLSKSDGFNQLKLPNLFNTKADSKNLLFPIFFTL